MGLLDSFAGLSGISAGSIVPDKLVSYATAPSSQLINEAWASTQSTFGGTGSFTRLNESAPSFDSLIAGAQFGTLSSDNPYLSTANIAETLASNAGAKADFSAAAINSATGQTANADNTEHKVKLTAAVSEGASFQMRTDPAFPFEPLTQSTVEFDVMPDVSENRQAEYEALAIPQLPGEFQKYRGTKSTVWTVSGVFTARTRTEALRNYVFLNTLRGWTVGYFGDKQKTQFPGKLGAPPPVLLFSGWRGLVGVVPVVLSSVQWNWPMDCDWIPTGIKNSTGQEVPFPTVLKVNINLIESFSAEQFNGFDLVAFRNGRMLGSSSFPGAYDLISRTSEPATAELASSANAGNAGVKNGIPEPTGTESRGQGALSERPGERAEYLRNTVTRNLPPALAPIAGGFATPQIPDISGVVNGINFNLF